jgi:hypothetical protein
VQAQAVVVTEVVVAMAAEMAVAMAAEVILWVAAQTTTTQLHQTKRKLTARREAATGSRAIAMRDTHEHP